MTTSALKQAVILAGGRGSRLKPLTDTIPKPMVQFHGRPFIDYLLEMLQQQGFKEVVLLIGYKGQQISQYCGDGNHWGLKIFYSQSKESNLTGMRLKIAKPLLKKTFLLMYCDNYWPMNIHKMLSTYKDHGTPALVTVYNNNDEYTRSNLRVDNNGKISFYDKSRSAVDLQGVDIGYFILDRDVLNYIPEGNVSFERTAMQLLIKQNKLAAYQTEHRYYSVGDHRRLTLTNSFLKPENVIILDRDGVLNEKASKGEYITSWENFKWKKGSKEAIKALGAMQYLILLVTNQAGIARGIMTDQDLNKLHEKLKEDVLKLGAEIASIYYCPHHWDDDCDCRKPKPGMLFKAQHDYNLNLSKIYFIGDDNRDGEAAQSAGCKFLKLSENQQLDKLLEEKEII